MILKFVRFIMDEDDCGLMSDLDSALKMQIDMIRAQAETQKNMYRQMYGSDPAMAEQFCAQIDQNTEMQINMIMQMMGGSQDPGEALLDQMSHARDVLGQLGYGEEEISAAMGDDAGDTLTERVLGDLDPSEFGYGDIVTAIASLDELGEMAPAPADADRMRRFEILLTGIISTLNDHQLDGLDVEPRNAESTDLVRSILSNYWGVEGREELIDTLRYLIVSGHTMDYVSALEAISSSKDASALHTEDMDEDDVAVSDARFAFTEAYAGKVDPAMLRGWDLGRAANVARWGYFVGFITEEETWGILDQIADGCMETFDSWRAFAQSYIFGSMYWKCPYGPDACYENIAGLMFAVEHLLTEGEWKDFPWASGRA